MHFKIIWKFFKHLKERITNHQMEYKTMTLRNIY